MIKNSLNNKPEIIIFTDEFGFQIFKKIISYFNLSKNKILFVFNRKRFCKMKFKFLNFKKYNYFLHSDNNNEFIKKICKPRIGIICSFNLYLKSKITRIFSLGLINIHIGDLPNYSGSNTLQWAIVNGEKKVGLTVHYVNKKIDSGPIIAKEFLEIKNLDTSNTLKQKIQLLIFSIIRRKLYSFRYNKFYSLKQDLKKKIVWRKRTKSDSQIIWSKHSDFEISCLTRAMTYPLPKPYYFDISGKKIVVESTMTPAQVKQFRKKIFNL